MKETQVCGSCYWFSLNHKKNGRNQMIFIEADKDKAQRCCPAIIINLKKTNSVSDVEYVPNLEKGMSQRLKSCDPDNRYFFKLVNRLDRLSFNHILESKLAILKHV